MWERFIDPSKRLPNGPQNAANAAAALVAPIAAGATARAEIAQARTARDTLAAELKPLGGKAPATVTGGVNTKTGEATAQACGGGKCAEDHVVDALGGNKADIKFTEAIRPRTGQEVPVCDRCEGKYGRGPFPPGTKFKTDQPPPPEKPKKE